MKHNILVLCTGNSCRSQMAEGFLRSFGCDHVTVFSAGVSPKNVEPMAVKVMKEVGIDISGHRSKSVGEFLGQKFDYLITVCDNAKNACPTFPGDYQKIHWDIPDPVGVVGTEEELLELYRKTRDQIKGHVDEFLKSLPEPACGANPPSGQKGIKGFFQNVFNKLDKQLEEKSKKCSCCGPCSDKKEDKGDSCCS